MLVCAADLREELAGDIEPRSPTRFTLQLFGFTIVYIEKQKFDFA